MYKQYIKPSYEVYVALAEINDSAGEKIVSIVPLHGDRVLIVTDKPLPIRRRETPPATSKY